MKTPIDDPYPIGFDDHLPTEDKIEILLDHKEELQSSIDFMKGEILEAKADSVDGHYSDKTWFRKINDAMKIKQRQVQKLQRIIKRLRQEQRDENEARTERRFIAIAKRDLESEDFAEMMREARDDNPV